MYVKTLPIFEAQLDYIFFVYGLSFIILGLSAILMQLRKSSDLPWKWLGIFGILHGINEWVGIIALLLPGDSSLGMIGSLINASSFIALLAFGRKALQGYMRMWIFVMLISSTALSLWLYPTESDQIIRYLLGFPAGVLSAVVLWKHAVSTGEISLKIAGTAFAIYAVAAGLIVPSGTFFFSGWLHHDSFLALSGFPVQLGRTVLAFIIAISVWSYYIAVQNCEDDVSIPIHPPLAKKLIIILIGISIGGFFLVNTMGERKESLMLKEFITRVSIIANIIDRHAITMLQGNENDIGTPSYEHLKNWLKEVNVASRFAYLMMIRDGQVYFMVDSEDPESPDCSPPGQLYEETSASFYTALKSQKPFIIGPESDHWGTYITAVVPLGNLLMQGEPVYLLFDIDYAEWKNDVALARQLAILITFLATVLIIYFFFASNKIFQIYARLKAERNLFIGGPAIIIKWKVSEIRWQVTYASSNLDAHLKISPTALFQDEHSLLELIHPDDQSIIIDGINELRNETREFEHELRLRHADGSYRWFHLFVIRQSDRYAEWFQGYFTEISTQKEAQESAAYFSTHDILTGLPKITILEEFFNKAKTIAKRNGSKVALMYLDLDRFNRINEAFGHAFGNDLILMLSHRLKEILPENTTIGREGGDEFILIVPDMQDHDEIALFVQKILWEIAKPFHIDAESIVLSSSIGIAVFPDDARYIAALLQQADTALAFAKDNEKGGYAFASKYANEKITRRLMIENQLHTALERNEFHLHYQPKMDQKSQKVSGAEALLRWNNPVLGNVSPADFIPIAEENGLIIPIGKWVLEEACRQNRLWQEKGLEPLHIAVNVSALQLKRHDFVAGIKLLLEQTTLLPCYLELELTESILANEHDMIISTLHELRSMGMEISIDDFGTGYSNFLYLKQFNVSKLKIDQSFIAEIERNGEVRTIVETMIKFAQTLNLSTIAEGVETEAQLKILAGFGCDEIQGYYFSKPLAADAFETYLQKYLV